MAKEPLVKAVIVLTVVCLVSAALLAYSYNLTYSIIQKQAQTALDEKLKDIFKDATGFDEKDDYYIAKNGNNLIGFAAVAQSPGYSSVLKILAGINMSKQIVGVRIIEQSETPGLGVRTTEPAFYTGFNGLISKDVVLKKYGGKVDGITGATISSKAVTVGVQTIMQQKLEALVDEQTKAK